MNDFLIESQAEVKALEFKLNRIRERLQERIPYAEPITKAELQFILAMISEYETVPYNWELEKPFVQQEEINDVQ